MRGGIGPKSQGISSFSPLGPLSHVRPRLVDAGASANAFRHVQRVHAFHGCSLLSLPLSLSLVLPHARLLATHPSVDLSAKAKQSLQFPLVLSPACLGHARPCNKNQASASDHIIQEPSLSMLSGLLWPRRRWRSLVKPECKEVRRLQSAGDDLVTAGRTPRSKPSICDEALMPDASAAFTLATSDCHRAPQPLLSAPELESEITLRHAHLFRACSKLSAQARTYFCPKGEPWTQRKPYSSPTSTTKRCLARLDVQPSQQKVSVKLSGPLYAEMVTTMCLPRAAISLRKPHGTVLVLASCVVAQAPASAKPPNANGKDSRGARVITLGGTQLEHLDPDLFQACLFQRLQVQTFFCAKGGLAWRTRRKSRLPGQTWTATAARTG